MFYKNKMVATTGGKYDVINGVSRPKRRSVKYAAICNHLESYYRKSMSFKNPVFSTEYNKLRD